MSTIVNYFQFIRRHFTTTSNLLLKIRPIVTTKTNVKIKYDNIESNSNIYENKNENKNENQNENQNENEDKLIDYIPPLKNWHPESNVIFPWEVSI